MQNVRKDIDSHLDRHEEVLPEVSDKLEQVADSLMKAATSLTGLAETLKESLGRISDDTNPTDDGKRDPIRQ